MVLFQRCFSVVILMLHLARKVKAYPQCVEEDGLPIAEAFSSTGRYSMVDCVKTCYRYQMENKRNFYNGVSFYPNKCRCLVNMTDIIPISPNGTKTCFFGPHVEELSLTLLEMPEEHRIEARESFEHLFSMSYTNLFGTAYTWLYAGSLSVREKHPMNIDTLSHSVKKANLPHQSGRLGTHLDDFGIKYRLHGSKGYVYLLDKGNLTENQHYYRTTFKMGDSSGSTDILFIAFVVNHNQEYGIYIRHTFIHQMERNDQSRASLKKLPSYYFSDDKALSGHIKRIGPFAIINYGNSTATNYTLDFFLPPLANLENLPEPSYAQNCGKVNALAEDIKENNAIRFKLQFVDPAMVYCQFYLRWYVGAEELRTTRKDMDYYVHGLLTYCPYRECNSVDKPFQMEEFKWGFTLLGRNKLDEYKQFRIKNVNSGRCWNVRDDNDHVRTNTKCQTEFEYTNNKYVMDTNSGKSLYHYTAIWNARYNFQAHVYRGMRLYYNRDNHISQFSSIRYLYCAMENETIIFRSKIRIRITAKCPPWRGVKPTAVKILEVWDDYNLDMRSVLKTTTPLGETIFVCNPGGDKGNTFNCFYSNNKGISWTALDALITNIRGYSTSSESIYGTMNRGKQYFLLNLTGGLLGHVKPLNNVDYNGMSTQETNIHTQSFNNVDLPTVPMETLFGSDVQVSSHGIYFMVNGILKKIFVWGY
ncbi:uncharacterized protein LOC130637740 [Hydractinia symbiolongicarpus]|uniref:uncharacterized protein LOC130637740 n=1 Tax=Hydractinia symbiolongicarpus TaxID=13093 RepID=UPI00254CA721|nr:uncharacterized protein LOC130637740 [Hydractinia symbiolongicarpus]